MDSHRRGVTHILCKVCYFLLKSFIFVGYGNDRFFSHTNLYISNVTQQCRCSPMLQYFELRLQQCVQSGPSFFFLLHANLRGEGRGFVGPLCNLNFGLPTCSYNLIDTMTSYSNTVSRAYFIYNQIWVSVGSKYHFSTLKKFCFVLSQLTPTP